MGSKSDEPDYMGLAEQQGQLNQQSNLDQTYANRAQQQTPFGYTDWSTEQVIDPGTGLPTTKWTQSSGLTPELQDQLNKQTALAGQRTDLAGSLANRMAGEFGQAADYGGLNPFAQNPQAQLTMPESYEGIAGIGDPTQMRNRAENAYYGKAMSRLQPQFDSQRQQLEVNMRNQGLGPEDEAWKSRMEGLGNQQNDAYGQAQYDAVRAGLGEQSQAWNQGLQGRQQSIGEANTQFNQALGSNAQNFGQNLQGATFANQMRQQQLAELLQQRGSSLNEMNAMLSGQQVGMPQMPGYNTANASQPANVYQAGGDQAAYDQATNPWAGIADLGGTLGAAALGNTNLFGG